MSTLDVAVPATTTQGQGKSGLKYKIEGTLLQSVVLELAPGQTIFSNTGAMSWMSANVNMNTTAGEGGLGGIFKRAVSGATVFLVDFEAVGNPGLVAFTADFPGRILPAELDAGQALIAQKQAFMCAEKSVTLDIAWSKRLGTGAFGGEGFIMQQITGPGLAFLEFDGEIVEYNLEPHQVLKVEPGHVAMYEPTVNFDIEMIKGLGNILFAGEGVFLATLQGPGRVWLQTMPIVNLARRLLPYLPKPSNHNDH
jgi:uncharacterized protein (TIGR00266 family)